MSSLDERSLEDLSDISDSPPLFSIDYDDLTRPTVRKARSPLRRMVATHAMMRPLPYRHADFFQAGGSILQSASPPTSPTSSSPSTSPASSPPSSQRPASLSALTAGSPPHLAITMVEDSIEALLAETRQREHLGQRDAKADAHLVDRLIAELARANRLIQILKRQEVQATLPSSSLTSAQDQTLIPLAVRSARFQARKQSELLKEKVAQMESQSKDYAALFEENVQLDKEVQSLQEELQIKGNLVADWQQNYDRATRQLEQLQLQLDNERSASQSKSLPSSPASPRSKTTQGQQSPSQPQPQPQSPSQKTQPQQQQFSPPSPSSGRESQRSLSQQALGSSSSFSALFSPALTPTVLPTDGQTSPSQKRTVRSSSESKSEKGSFWQAWSPRRPQSAEVLGSECEKLREAVKAHQLQNALLSNELIRLQSELNARPLSQPVASLKRLARLQQKESSSDDEEVEQALFNEVKLLRKRYFSSLVRLEHLRSHIFHQTTVADQSAHLWKQVKQLSLDDWESAIATFMHPKCPHEASPIFSDSDSRSFEEQRPGPDTSPLAVNLSCEDESML